MPKNKKIKIRRTWKINPVEQVKEDKEEIDPCEECGIYKTNPEACLKCENYDIEEF